MSWTLHIFWKLGGFKASVSVTLRDRQLWITFEMQQAAFGRIKHVEQMEGPRKKGSGIDSEILHLKTREDLMTRRREASDFHPMISCPEW